MALGYRYAPSQSTNAPTHQSPRLLDRLRQALRTKHYAYRTEQTYVYWVRRFILHHGKRHPREMGAPEIEAFLSHLAVAGRVSASTQTQALCAVLFLYKHVLRIDLPALDAVRARRPKRLPVVLSRSEVRHLLHAVNGSHGVYRLMAGLMYGSGLRLMECCRLRVKDVDLERRQLIVREAKGDKDRAVPLANASCDALRRQIAWRAELHELDLKNGQGRAELPTALERKCPSAAYQLGWQFVFASDRLSRCPRTGRPGRHHLHESAVGAAISKAAHSSGLRKRVTCHALRHAYA